MASTKNYRNFILEKLALLDDITYRNMIGEYLLYYKGTLFGGIYDDRFLVKIVSTNENFGMKKEEPYRNAKLMYLVSDIDDKKRLKEIVLDTCKGLSR